MMHPRFYSPFYRNFNPCNVDFHSHNLEHVNDNPIKKNSSTDDFLSSVSASSVDNPNLLKFSSFSDDDFLILLLILFLLFEQTNDYPLLISLVLLLLD